MYITKKICKECGSKLHKTNLGMKFFCKKCYEYKIVVEEDVSLIIWGLINEKEKENNTTSKN